MRNVDFEIPYLKQQAAKEQQQLADQERKHTEHLHSAVQAAKQYQQVSAFDSRHPCAHCNSISRLLCWVAQTLQWEPLLLYGLYERVG